MKRWLTSIPIIIVTLALLIFSHNMFWKKEYKNISEYPADKWAGATSGTKGENYTLFRINQGLKDAIGHPDYPIRVGVTVPVASMQDANPTLDALEDMLSERIEKDGSGVLVLVIASLDGEQFKEFVFYTKENVDFKGLHEDLKKAFPTLNIQFYAEKDPQWSVYNEYVK